MNVWIGAGVIAGLIAGSPVLPAQSQQLVRIKGIWLDPNQRPQAPGARYRISLERGGVRHGPVPVSTEFYTDDRLWLEVQTRNSAVVYVINRTLPSRESASALLPDLTSPQYLPHLVFGPERISPGRLVPVPKGPTAMRLDGVEGTEQLFIVLSRGRVPWLEYQFDATGALRSGNTRNLQELEQKLSEWASNGDCAVPEPGSKGAVADNDGYGLARQDDRPVMFEVNLRHVQ